MVAARIARYLLVRLARLVFVLFAVSLITIVRLSRYDNQCFVWYDVHTTNIPTWRDQDAAQDVAPPGDAAPRPRRPPGGVGEESCWCVTCARLRRLVY